MLNTHTYTHICNIVCSYYAYMYTCIKQQLNEMAMNLKMSKKGVYDTDWWEEREVKIILLYYNPK